jgi:hypothetical protein
MSSSTSSSINFIKSAVVLIAVAAVFYGTAQYLLWGLEADSIEFPVHLSEGREYTRDLQAKWNVYYQIRLDSERNLDLQRQNCLLGIENVVPEQCADIPSELLLSWRVENNNTVVASGNSDDTNEGYWDLKMGKVLGSFLATKGETYYLLVQVVETSATLQQTNPHIKIEIRPEDLKWTYVWIGILSQAAAFCLLLAIVLLLIFGGRNIRTRLDSSDR